jgi:hypothetical protein
MDLRPGYGKHAPAGDHSGDSSGFATPAVIRLGEITAQYKFQAWDDWLFRN